MSSQHLSDEAVAACADGVLTGHARDRASRHIAGCGECAVAVRVQREAAWALRAAPAPALPTGLLDRLRTVPQDAPVAELPAAVADDGSPMPSALVPMAALVPPNSDRRASGAENGSAAGRPGHRAWPSFTSVATQLFRSDDR